MIETDNDKWSDLGHILKVKCKRFADGLDVRCKGKIGARDDSKNEGLNN